MTDLLIVDGGTSALGIDAGAGGGVLSSLSSVAEPRRPVTAQERQREREEKRRKRQERAKERERKMKEKERREGKQGDSLGGVLLSDNDKSLLQRWTMMMDRRNEKSQIPSNDGAKNKDCKVNSHQCIAMGVDSQGALDNKTDKEARKIQSHHHLISDVKASQQGMFQPTSTQQPPLLFSMSHRKPPADIAVAVNGGIDIMNVTDGFVKNNMLKPHSETNGQSSFSCLGNWSGHQLEARPPQQPQPNRKMQPPATSFLQPQLQAQTQPDTPPQSQLLPLETFLTKAPALTTREKNGNVDIGGQNNLNSQSNPSTASAGPIEKLCPTVGEKSGTQTTNPLCGALGVPTQPHPSLGFTDTGQQGPSITPDIHTVTLQLSKSQVCLRFSCTYYIFLKIYTSSLNATIVCYELILRTQSSLTQCLPLLSCQVEDVLPPVFSVTPKGSGAGYGVGFDLDDLFNQSLTDLQHCDRDR